MPDSMISAAHNAQQVQSSEVEGTGSVLADLTSIGKAQKLQLDQTLQKASASVVGQTSVSTQGENEKSAFVCNFAQSCLF